MLVSFAQPWNAFAPTVVTASKLKFQFSRFAQFLKVLPLIAVIAPSAVTVFKEVQPLNNDAGNEVIFEGRWISSKAVQSKNKLPPNVLTVSGMVMFFNAVQPSNMLVAKAVSAAFSSKFTVCKEVHSANAF